MGTPSWGAVVRLTAALVAAPTLRRGPVAASWPRVCLSPPSEDRVAARDWRFGFVALTVCGLRAPAGESGHLAGSPGPSVGTGFRRESRCIWSWMKGPDLRRPRLRHPEPRRRAVAGAGTCHKSDRLRPGFGTTPRGFEPFAANRTGGSRPGRSEGTDAGAMRAAQHRAQVSSQKPRALVTCAPCRRPATYQRRGPIKAIGFILRILTQNSYAAASSPEFLSVVPRFSLKG